MLAAAASPMAIVAADGVAKEIAVKKDSPQVKALAGGISVDIPGEAQQHVQIYALTGQVVKQFEAAPGQTTVELPSGYYIVRIGSFTVKVAVK